MTGQAPTGQMTIDELARRAGTTTRNIRAYQERGLVPRPRVVGRVGYYDEGHLARLQHIAQLLDRGFSLASIRELFEAWEQGYGLADVLGFEQALAAPWDTEASAKLTAREMADLFGPEGTAVQERAVALGLVSPEGDGFRAPSPRLLHAGAELMAAGVPLEKVLDEAETLSQDLERVAERFVALFLEHVWKPYAERGMPRDELARITDALHRLRPLAAMSVDALLAQAMRKKVAELSAETLAEVPPASSAAL